MLDDLLNTTMKILDLGGPVVAILSALSLLATTIIIAKIFQFRQARLGRQVNTREAVGLYRTGAHHKAAARLQRSCGHLGAILFETIRLVDSEELDRKSIEEEIGRLAGSRLHELQRGLRILDTIVQIAPLLGLFGTVLGMIEAFQQLQSAGNAVNPSLLAGGIWVALLTTAVGLGVAMPVSVALTWFETRIDNERVAIETLVGEIFATQKLYPATIVNVHAQRQHNTNDQYWDQRHVPSH